MKVENGKISVTILDKEYPLEGAGETEQIQEIERYVDQKLRELKQSVPMIPLGRLAILACLNIANELYEQRTVFKYRLDRYENIVDSAISAIDDAL